MADLMKEVSESFSRHVETEDNKFSYKVFRDKDKGNIVEYKGGLLQAMMPITITPLQIERIIHGALDNKWFKKNHMVYIHGGGNPKLREYEEASALIIAGKRLPICHYEALSYIHVDRYMLVAAISKYYTEFLVKDRDDVDIPPIESLYEEECGEILQLAMFGEIKYKTKRPKEEELNEQSSEENPKFRTADGKESIFPVSLEGQ